MTTNGAVLNIMTVDVEDYFQVSAFENSVARADWDQLESRVCRNTERLLGIFERFGVRATFFVLGWVAERYPGLVRQIARAGHEVASHGHEHRLVYSSSFEEFRTDLRRARAALERAAAAPVFGYRAPSYSITRQSLWALDILIAEGYAYDASIYPIRHDRYGIPGWRRHIHLIERPRGAILELPGSTVRRLGATLPIGGGGYFRLLPYEWTRQGIRDVNCREGQPVVFYVHPWEIDPDQPRMQGSPLSRLRHYRNLHKTAHRLEALLKEFRFGTVSDVVQRSFAAPAVTAPVFASAWATGVTATRGLVASGQTNVHRGADFHRHTPGLNGAK